MIALLLLTWLVIQLVQAIRSKDTVVVVIAVVGIVIALLVCFGVIGPIRCVETRL
jgi:hypothetical protein